MNSAVLYCLLPFVGLALFWRRTACERDRLLVRRRWMLLFSGIAAALVLSSTIMTSTARQMQGRVQPTEVLGGASFLVSILLIYTALRRGLLAVILRLSSSTSPRSEPTGKPTQPRWAEYLSAVIALFLFLPFHLTATNCHRPKIGNALTPGSVGMDYERVALRTSDGVRLSGWFIPAANPGKTSKRSSPTVLLCHGLGTNSGNFLPFAEWLHGKGYAVMMFDFRGHGDSAGHVVSFGYYEAQDVEAAVRYLKSRRDCDPKRIVGYGLSMGGAALTMSLKRGNPFCGIILDSSFSDLRVAQSEFLARLLGPLCGEVISLMNVCCFFELRITPKSIRPVRWISRAAPRPLLIIHGTADRTIPVSEGKALFAAAGEPKSLWLVPDADHLQAQSRHPGEYQRLVLDFLRKASAVTESPPR